MAGLKIKSADDPTLRQAVRAVRALKLALAEYQQITIRTPLVQAKEEAEALRAALIAHTRDPLGGLERFRFQERSHWRLVKEVIKRARAQDDQAGTLEQ